MTLNARFHELITRMSPDDCVVLSIKATEQSYYKRVCQTRSQRGPQAYRTVAHGDKLYVIRVE